MHYWIVKMYFNPCYCKKTKKAKVQFDPFWLEVEKVGKTFIFLGKLPKS